MLDFHTKDNSAQKQQTFLSRDSEMLMRGVSFRVWDVDAADIQYQYDEGHTLSLYLKGGEKTYRYDHKDLKGQAGKLCLMPQGHLSRWHSASPIRIAHLYIPDQLIRQEAERQLDIDAQHANLRDIVYQHDESLRVAMLRLVAALKSGADIDPLLTEEALYSVSSGLIERYCQNTPIGKNTGRGLSTIDRQYIKAYIHRYLGQKLTIETLASQLHLSPFHFSRMFKRSFGDSPANYIIRQRIELSKTLIANNFHLSSIAVECGFSHQSHFNNYFKKYYGVTPTQYRNLIKN